MNDIKVISDKILSQANIKAESTIAEAREQCDERLKNAAENAAQIRGRFDAEKDAVIKGIVDKKKVSANLEVKRILLEAKQEVLSCVFDSALEKIKKLKKTDYQKLIGAMIKQNATDKDTVVISSNDKDVITKAFIDKIAKELKIKLSLGKDFADIKGGIILLSKGCEKNMSIEAELSVLREELESEIAKNLW